MVGVLRLYEDPWFTFRFAEAHFIALILPLAFLRSPEI
jgi:hypothetical protein